MLLQKYSDPVGNHIEQSCGWFYKQLFISKKISPLLPSLIPTGYILERRKVK